MFTSETQVFKLQKRVTLSIFPLLKSTFILGEGVYKCFSFTYKQSLSMTLCNVHALSNVIVKWNVVADCVVSVWSVHAIDEIS